MNGLIALLAILIPITLIVCFLHAILFHKQSRDRLEATCVKESHFKTFFDNFISNVFIMLPIILVIVVLTIIAEALL